MEPITRAKGTRRRLRWGSWLAVTVLMLGLSLVALPALPALAASIALSTTSLQPGQVPVVNGIGFAKTEKISLWLTAPDRTVQPYGAVYSDDNGNFSNYSYSAASNFTQQPGFWYITAQGLMSSHQAIVSFTVGQVETPAPNPNPPVVTPAPVVTPPPPVEVAPGAPTLTVANNVLRMDELPVVSGSGYNGNERVDFWLTGPDGSVKTYGFAYANPDGTISPVSFAPAPLKGETQAQANLRTTGQFGLWYITGHGNASDKTGISNFVVTGPTLTASISSINGNVVTITYNATNFFALESVSLWLTDTYGNVTSLGSTYARLDGGLPSLEDSVGNIINTLTFLDTGLTGPYTMTAQGQSSHFIVQAVVANPLAS